jgi:hypothetical protein
VVSLVLETLRKIATKTWFRFFLILFLIYKSIFNAYSADFIFPRAVSAFTNAELAIDVKTFSLFFGLDARAIRFKTKAPFASENLFEAKRLALRYNLLSLIFLKLKITEVAIESGILFLHEKDGVWNYSVIAKPSQPKVVPEEPPSEPLEEIRTYLPFAAEAHLNLSQFHLRILKESESRLAADVSDFNLRMDLVSNRFTSLPLNLELLDQIDTFYLALNPDRSIPIAVETPILNWKQTLPLSLLLDWKNESTKPRFLFSANIGSDQIQLEYKKRPIVFGLSLSQLIEFFPEQEEVLIQQFSLKGMGDTWLGLEGNIKDILKENRSIDIKVKESKIKLAPVNRIVSELEGILPKMKLGGELSLEGTQVTGVWKEAIVNLRMLGRDIFFSQGNARAHRVSSLDLDLVSNLDLGTKAEKTAENPIPLLTSFSTKQFSVVYNDIKLLLAGSYKKENNLSLQANIENVNISDFTSLVQGRAKANLAVEARDFSFLTTTINLSVDGFRYAIERSRSPASRLLLEGNLGLSFDRPFGLASVKFPILTLTQRTLAGGKALNLDLMGSVALGESTHIYTTPASLSLHIPFLLQTVPLILKEKIAPLQNIIGNEPSLKIKSDILLSKQGQKIRSNITGIIPGLELKDLTIDLDIDLQSGKEKKIQIKSLLVSAYQKIVSLKVSGNLEERASETKAPLGSFFGSLDTKLTVASPDKRYLLKGISFLGNLEFAAQIRDFDVKGSLVSSQSNIFHTNQKCPGVQCKVILVDGLNANIPFQHNLAWKNQNSLIVGDKSVFIKTYGRSAEPNLKINQVVGTHPSISDLPFEYVKKQANSPGLQARIDYRENYATIEDLKVHSLDGLLLGKNMVFNLGSGNPAFMEFRGNVQIRDIDLKQLMAPKVRDKIDDGKLKADLNLSIRDLTEPVANMDLFFSIFQIGRDFGKSALNVISPQNFLIDRIADSYSVNKIDVSLSKGLVYADVFFRRSLLSLFINLEDSKISQQRMPLANFLKRAQSEIQTYQ